MLLCTDNYEGEDNSPGEVCSTEYVYIFTLEASNAHLVSCDVRHLSSWG